MDQFPSKLIIDGAEILRNKALYYFGGGIYQVNGFFEQGEVFYEGNTEADLGGTGGYGYNLNRGGDIHCSGSGCPVGSFGNCTSLGGGSACFSCVLNECTECPAGKAVSTPHSVTIDDCESCPEGYFVSDTGATQCDGPCTAGHFVSDSEEDGDGFGKTTGGTHCNPCELLL